MTFSAAFIRRPVATSLLAIFLLIAGAVAYRFLPVAALPSIDIPTIVVFAGRPGADPENIGTAIAAPLERRLGEIAGVTEITSTSATGSTLIIVQFDIGRDIDSAAHDVQAAINAAAPDLPSDLPVRPFFRKFNPAEMPVLTIALTSDTLSTAQVYDAADSILAQRLAQVEGVAQVQVNGSETPAVRIRLNPAALAAAGLSGEDVAAAVRAANVTGPLGGFEGPDRAETIATNGQLAHAADYRGLVLKSAGGAIVRLADVATIIDGVANTRLAAWFGKQPAILLTVSKSAGANVIETVDHVKAVLPLLKSWLPPDITLTILADRTKSIRDSINEVQLTLLITVALVLLVVALFMRRLVPTIAAGVTVPLSIAGTLAAMWFNGFALDNFSLLALTISVGFVVDDAIVMIENIIRHMEQGKPPMQAAFEGAAQIGFTVMSISVSLVAVFIPVLFMGGIMGRLFHEFATTLTLAIAISALVSLTLTPMLCGHILRPRADRKRTALARLDSAVERGFQAVLRFYAVTLEGGVALALAHAGAHRRHRRPDHLALHRGAEGLLPHPGHRAAGRQHRRRAGKSPSPPWPSASAPWWTCCWPIRRWPRSARPSASPMAGAPEPRPAHHQPQAAGRARRAVVRAGDRPAAAEARPGRRGADQFVVHPGHCAPAAGRARPTSSCCSARICGELRDWTEKLTAKLRTVPLLTDVTSDQDRAGPQADVAIDRVAAARLGVSVAAIDAALGNAFAQRQISVIYTPRNQYRVVLEVDPRLQADPDSLQPHFRRRGGRGGRCRCSAWYACDARHGTAVGAPPGPVPRRHDQLQHRPGRCPGRRACRGAGRRARVAHARDGAHGLRRQRALADAEPGDRSRS